ncbi:MAG: enoyl-CoA hydratase/isomerase family protein [Spirochaetia bacterium]|nr:enoyl-CoA hydratase/isomerase family protein [Spirochaetia bacterium]
MAESPASGRLVDTEIRKAAAGGEIGVLYLDDPSTRNAFSLELAMAFNRALDDLASHEPLLRALVITGRNGVFSSGGDLGLLRSFAEKPAAENKEFMYSFYRLFLRVRDMPFPVLAAVNGHAIGASLAMALACDLRYFEPDAKYAFNFVRIGIHPGMGSTYLAIEAAGMAQAQELLLTGRTVSGDEMLRRGLCHGVYDGDVMLERVLAVAEEIAGASPLAVRLTKRSLFAAEAALNQALENEADSQAKTYLTADFKEAMKAVEEKRKPHFTDS